MPIPAEVAALGIDEETWDNLGRAWDALIDLEHFPDHAWKNVSPLGQILFARDSSPLFLALGGVISRVWRYEEQLRIKRN